LQILEDTGKILVLPVLCDIAEILLKVALSTKKSKSKSSFTNQKTILNIYSEEKPELDMRESTPYW
jgi:hypothetical protein